MSEHGTDRLIGFNQVNDRAVSWARERAETAPDEEWRTVWTLVADGLATNVGSREIVKRAVAAGFDPKRAEGSVGTAIAHANSFAALLDYMASRRSGVRIRKVWLAAPGSCRICAANAKQGPIALERPFKSGHLTPPAHLDCRCALSPHVDR